MLRPASFCNALHKGHLAGKHISGAYKIHNTTLTKMLFPKQLSMKILFHYACDEWNDTVVCVSLLKILPVYIVTSFHLKRNRIKDPNHSVWHTTFNFWCRWHLFI